MKLLALSISLILSAISCVAQFYIPISAQFFDNVGTTNLYCVNTNVGGVSSFGMVISPNQILMEKQPSIFGGNPVGPFTAHFFPSSVDLQGIGNAGILCGLSQLGSNFVSAGITFTHMDGVTKPANFSGTNLWIMDDGLWIRSGPFGYGTPNLYVDGNIFCLGTLSATTNILWQTNNTMLATNAINATYASYSQVATNAPDGAPLLSTNDLYNYTPHFVSGTLTNDTTGNAATATFSKTCTGLGYTNIYRALLTQLGTAAPTAVVLENTFGTGSPYTNLVWSRVGVGNYSVTFTNGFPQHKTYFTIGVNSPFGYGSSICQSTLWVSTNVLYIYFTYGNGMGKEDGDMVDAPFEILVYP